MTARKRIIGVTTGVVYYLCLVGLLFYLSGVHPPLRPWFWHSLMKVCNKVAYTVGRVGIQAEAAYGVAMEKVRQ
jgi:hypothetical protein